MVTNIIIDGHILNGNLNYTGNDELWLQNQLISQGFDNIHDVFLATCDSNNNISVYLKKDFNNSHDIFE